MTTYRPGCGLGSPIGDSERAAAAAWNAAAPDAVTQLRALLADPNASESERKFAEEWLADLDREEGEASDAA